MEFLSNSKRHKKHLIKKELSRLNEEVDEYVLANHSYFIMLIHVYYYEMMDFFNQREQDMKNKEELKYPNNSNSTRQIIIISIPNFDELYKSLKNEFNKIFDGLDHFQLNLKSIAFKIITNQITYTDTKLTTLVNNTISEIILSLCLWIKSVRTQHLDLIMDFSRVTDNGDALFIQEFLNKVEDLLEMNIKNYNPKNCRHNTDIHSSINSISITSSRSKIPIGIEYNPITPLNYRSFTKADSYPAVLNTFILPKPLLVHPKYKKRQTAFYGGKKSKKKQPRKKSKKNNTRKNKYTIREADLIL